MPVLRCPDYVIGYEDYDGLTFAHIHWLGRTSAQTIRACRAHWDALFALHGAPIHTLSLRPHEGSVRKHRKFVEMMGFEINRLVPCVDGQERALYTRWK